jgi:hypothetical protein
MVDRQELDALLVGALYGELTPADEARLAAHLESHPADRSALEDLKTARAAVRESRVFEDQVEPSQALSAMLLQEAHRRAPRAASETSTEGWLSRFMRMFVAHPAMAAAATLVVVVGVASTMYLRQGKLDTADPAAERVAMEKAPEPAAPAPAAAAVPTAPTGGAPVAAGSAASDHDSSETAKVDLATTTQGQRAAPSPTSSAGLGGHGEDRAAYSREHKAPNTIAFDGDFAKGANVAVTKAAAKPTAHLAAMPAHADKNAGYLEVRKDDLVPKEMDEGQAAADRDGRGNSNGPASGGSGGGAGAPGRALAPPAMATPTPAPAAPAKISAKQKTEAADKPAPPPTDPQLDGQLKLAVKYTSDKNCDDTVKITNGIRDRSPAFYAQNVTGPAGDNIALKYCMAYIKGQDDQIARRRAAKAKAAPADEQTTTPPAASPPASCPRSDTHRRSGSRAGVAHR